MRFVKLSVDRFAGLARREFEFDAGMNVLLGGNETGKSTVIDALEAALFLPTTIKGTSCAALAQKERLKSILPISGGDCAITLDFEHGGKAYTITKQWGQEPMSSFRAGTDIFTGDGNVSAKLGELLPFSEATVCSLAFAKQGAFKQTIDNIRSAGAKDISDFLSRAACDLGGVSVKELKQNLQNEYNRLTGNWDMERALPKNGKGIDNPYGRGNGDIINHYYARERAKRDLISLEEKENAAAKLSVQIRSVTDDISKLETEYSELSAVSGGLVLRREKDIAIGKLENELAHVDAVKKDWIEREKALKEITADIEKENKLLTDAQLVIAAWDDFAQGETARAALDKLKSLGDTAAEVSSQLDALPDISAAEIDDWKMREKEIMLFESAQNSATITAKVTSDAPVYAEDAAGRRAVAGKISAQGHVTIYIGDSTAVDITAGDCADADSEISYRVSKQLCRALADKYNLKNADKAADALHLREILSKRLSDIKKQTSDLLNEKSESELLAAAAAPRPDENKEHALKTLDEKKASLARLQLCAEQTRDKLSEYEETFGVYSAALEAEQLLKEQIAPLRLEAEKLSVDCPPEYENAETFIARLEYVRTAISEKRAALDALKNEQSEYVCDMTAKEAAFEAERQNELLAASIVRAQTIGRILLAVDETLSSVQSRAYSGLGERFCTHLSSLTQGRYNVSDLNDELVFTLSRADMQIPPSLLSEGTADALALAFRFAMLDDIMADGGMCVLDDCLVDLDDERAEAAANLIREYAREHQVIFATFAEKAASLLGGNVINMRERI